jgi:hypothetical protein
MNGPCPEPHNIRPALVKDDRVYRSSPYKYPISNDGTVPPHDRQQVVRVPVAGPGPYNTLVVLRQTCGIMGTPDEYTVATDLVLAGWASRNDEQRKVEHSTMGTIRIMATTGQKWLTDDDNIIFTYALDKVADCYHIDDNGRFHLRYKSASSFGEFEYAGAAVEFSSWVLCWQPPTD